MPEAVARLVAGGHANLTPQMLVDFALKADQDRREAVRAGNRERAVELEEERDALLALAQEK